MRAQGHTITYFTLPLPAEAWAQLDLPALRKYKLQPDKHPSKPGSWLRHACSILSMSEIPFFFFSLSMAAPMFGKWSLTFC